MNTNQKIDKKFSVVIPTLGGESLARTIGMINNGTLVPDEILICLPEDFASRVSEISTIPNVKIIATECKGQVKQRIEGFKKIENDFVIQLDDDIYVYETCFEKLMESITGIEGNVAIAPALVFEPGGSSCYDMTHADSRLTTMIHGKNWFRPGNITRTGMNMGMNVFKEKDRYNTVDWVPGGCVAHKKHNLILADYYPFKGKAYYEDVLHSIQLAKKQVKLLIDKSAVCGIDPYDAIPSSHLTPVRIYNTYFKYRRHIIKSRGQTTMYLIADGLFTYYSIARDAIKYTVRYSFYRITGRKI